MRVAPPVQALSCGAGPWQMIQCLLYALSAAVACGWAGAHWRQPDAWLALASLLAGFGAVVASARLWRVPTRSLAWDGSTWQLTADGEPRCGQVVPMLDLGHWMLVRFVCAVASGHRGRAVWLPLSRRDSPAVWTALRVALHAPQPAQRAA